MDPKQNRLQKKEKGKEKSGPDQLPDSDSELDSAWETTNENSNGPEESIAWKGNHLIIQPSGGQLILEALKTQDVVIGRDDRMLDLRLASPVLYVSSGVDICWKTSHYLIFESFGDIVFEEGVRIVNNGGANFSLIADKGHQNHGSIHLLGEGPILEFGPSSQINFYGNQASNRPWRNDHLPKSLFTYYQYIYQTQDLDLIRNNLAGSYLLVADINLESPDLEDPLLFQPIGTVRDPFTGTFNGNEHTIRGLRQHYQENVTRETLTGLFGFVDQANFVNLKIDQAQIQIATKPNRSPEFGSFLIANAKHTQLYKVSLSRSKFHGNVTHFGGLVGYGEGCLFHQCQIEGPENDVNFPTEIQKLEDYGPEWVVMARSKGNRFKLGGFLGAGKNCRFVENQIQGLVFWEDPLPFGTRGYRNQYIETGKLLAPSVAHQDELRMWPAISQGISANLRQNAPNLLDWAKNLQKTIGGMVGELENGRFKGNCVSNLKLHLDMLTAIGGCVGRSRNFLKIVDTNVSFLLIHNPQLMLLGALIGFSEPNIEQNSNNTMSVFRDSYCIKRSNFSHITTNDPYFNQTTFRFSDGRIMPLYPIGKVGFSRLIDQSQYQSLVTYEQTERDRQAQIAAQTESARQTQLTLTNHTRSLDQATSQLNSSLASLAGDSKRLDRRRSKFFKGLCKERRFVNAVEHNQKRVTAWTANRNNCLTTVNQWKKSLQNIKDQLAELNHGCLPVESLPYLTTPLSQVKTLAIQIPSIRSRKHQWIKPVLAVTAVVAGVLLLQPQLAAIGISLSVKIGVATAGGIAGLTIRPGQKDTNAFVLPTGQELKRLPTENQFNLDPATNRQGLTQIRSNFESPTLLLSLLDSDPTSSTPSSQRLSTEAGEDEPITFPSYDQTDLMDNQLLPVCSSRSNFGLDIHQPNPVVVLPSWSRSLKLLPLLPSSPNLGLTISFHQPGQGWINFDYNHQPIEMSTIQLLPPTYLNLTDRHDFIFVLRNKDLNSRLTVANTSSRSGRSKERTSDRTNRSSSPERLTDTSFEESTRWLTSKIEGCYQAQHNLSLSTVNDHLLPALAAYGIDGLILVNDGLDFLTLGGWSSLTGLLDQGAEIAGSKVRQVSRDLSDHQRFSQNLGDSVYLVLSLAGGKGIGTVKNLGRLKLKGKPPMGEYRHAKGHHVHAKKAFEGHVKYDPKQGLSISHDYMKQLGVDHQKVTTAQRRLFGQLARSGKPNIIKEHTRIAVEALIEGGASRSTARQIVAKSLNSLRNEGVTVPMNIPWYS